jgi:V-type H+-transporting ATPase subunit d
MELSFFNIHDGFPEAVIRGFRSGFLTADDYRRIAAAESLEDMRTALDDTDYGQFMQDEPSPLEVPMVVRCAKAKLAHEFRFLRSQAVEPMSRFLDFVAAEKMINNVIMLLQGTLNNKPPKELLSSFELDPLGWFEEMKTIPTLDPSGGYRDLYQTILIDTPVGPYFEAFLSSLQGEDGNVDVVQVLNETDLDIMKNILRKAWLEDFYAFCMSLGGTTAGVMGHILKTEADFAVMSVTLNALNTPLGSAQQQLEDRNALYPNFGYLFPEGAQNVRKAFNETTVRAALEPYGEYCKLYDACKEFYNADTKQKGVGKVKSIEDLLYVENVRMYELAFEEQFHYGVAYAWVKLREQEIRNMEWMANMIIMDRRDKMDDVVPIFKTRM